MCVCVCEGDSGSVENKMQEEEQPSKAIKNSRCNLSWNGNSNSAVETWD